MLNEAVVMKDGEPDIRSTVKMLERKYNGNIPYAAVHEISLLALGAGATPLMLEPIIATQKGERLSSLVEAVNREYGVQKELYGMAYGID